MRSKWVSRQRTTIVGRTWGTQATARARKENLLIDRWLEERRKHWTFEPSSMAIRLYKNAGVVPAGIVVSVSHEFGRMILHKRMGTILESDDVAIDIEIDCDNFEDVIEAMNLVPINATA